MTSFPLHAKTLFGLEGVLAAELETLGAEDVQQGNRLVTFTADQALMYRANVCCRTAIRFLKPILSFAAESERELYAGTQRIDWARFLDADQTLWIDPLVHSSFTTHSQYAAQLTKDAIVDQFRDRSGQRPSVDRDDPGLRISLHLVKNRATVYTDASGDSLHMRGYRRASGDAPLNEVLAAGMLKLSEWDAASPLVDPMCGSGTLLIEAAMLARGIPPGGLGRRFGFMRWKDFDAALFQSIRDKARAAQLDKLPLPILGSDIDAAVIEIAKQNACRAGVTDDIQFSTGSFEVAAPPSTPATLITNPPYDERMKIERVAGLYRRLGDALKQRFAGCNAFVLTGNLEAAKQIGLRTSRKIKLFNGAIECRMLKFELYEGSRRDDVAAASSRTPTVAEASSRTRMETAAGSRSHVPAKWNEQAEMFRNRLTRMAKHWHKWARRQGVTCFRLYDKDIPDVPLAIDWYEGHLHIAEYARPHDRADAEHRVWLDFIVQTVAETLSVDMDRVFVKRRQRQKGKSQYERQDDSRRRLEVGEGGHRFLVNLADYLDTGLFLDHRQTRAMVQEAAGGKHFLNLFAYTGAFTVYAAAGGAASTTTVDLSATYLDWAGDNMRLNGFTGEEHEYIRRDAMKFLEYRAEHGGRPFDLAVVDPPTFSNSKKLDDVWDVQQRHAELLNLLLTQMSPGGVIYFSSNLRRFKLHEEKITGAEIREITAQTIPPDFRNKRVHRCWVLTPI